MFTACLHSAGVMLVWVPVILTLGKDGMERPDPSPSSLTLPPLPILLEPLTHRPWLLLKWDFKMVPPALTLAFPGGSGASVLLTLVHIHHFFFPGPALRPRLSLCNSSSCFVLDLCARLLTYSSKTGTCVLILFSSSRQHTVGVQQKFAK